MQPVGLRNITMSPDYAQNYIPTSVHKIIQQIHNWLDEPMRKHDSVDLGSSFTFIFLHFIFIFTFNFTLLYILLYSKLKSLLNSYKKNIGKGRRCCKHSLKVSVSKDYIMVALTQ